MLEDQIEPAPQKLRASFRGRGAPAGKGIMRRLDRADGVGGGAAWRVADGFPIGRVMNGEARAVGGIPPFATDQRLLPE